MPRVTNWIALLCLAPLLMAGTCRKKGDGDVTDGDAVIRTPDVKLQVISVDPGTVTAGRQFTLTVYGSAFEEGAVVWFGENRATEVARRNANTLTVSGPALSPGDYDVRVVHTSTGDSAVLRGALSAVDRSADSGDSCRSATFYFDYNSHSLTSSASSELSEVARCLSPKDWAVRLEGHCDERGTTDYNIALGQRRANAVKDALVNQGVSPSRIRTVSYGEERPAVQGSGESVWSKNRRVELKASD
jgi:peptidoglycan-associated lipoprotein